MAQSIRYNTHTHNAAHNLTLTIAYTFYSFTCPFCVRVRPAYHLRAKVLSNFIIFSPHWTERLRERERARERPILFIWLKICPPMGGTKGERQGVHPQGRVVWSVHYTKKNARNESQGKLHHLIKMCISFNGHSSFVLKRVRNPLCSGEVITSHFAHDIQPPSTCARMEDPG